MLYVCGGILLRFIKEGNSAICARWMNHEDIMPSEISLSKKTNTYMRYLKVISQNQRVESWLPGAGWRKNSELLINRGQSFSPLN